MSTPNPLAPQGSLLEQQAKGRSTFQVISFIGAVHVVLLCGILWTACGNDKPKTEGASTLGTDPTPIPIPISAPSGENNLPSPALSNIVSAPSGAGSGMPVANPPSYATTAGGIPAVPTNPTITSPPPSLPPGNVGFGNPATSSPLVNETPGPGGATGEYKVAKGDIGTSIAKKNGVSLKALVAANPTVNWNRLKIGQAIQIPAGASTPAGTGHRANVGLGTLAATESAPSEGAIYVVKAGDTGTKIASKNGVKWAAIRKANNLKSDALHPGQKLVIPRHNAANPTPAPATELSPPAGGTPLAPPPASLPVAIPLPPRTPPR